MKPTLAIALAAALFGCGESDGTQTSSSSSSSGGSGPAFLADGKAAQELKGGQFQDLQVRFPLPSTLPKHDVLRFYLDLSYDTNDACFVEFAKGALDGKTEVPLWVAKPDGSAGDFQYATFAVGMKHLVDYPRTAEKDVVNTVTVYAKAHVKTGEEETWSPTRKAWVKTPVYDRGEELCRGKLEIRLEKKTGIDDGVIEVPLADPQIRSVTVNESEEGLSWTGFSFVLPIGKDRWGNDATWMGMRVVHCEGVSAAELREDLKNWLSEKSSKRRYYLLQVRESAGVSIQDWAAEGDWQVLRAERANGFRLTLAVREAKGRTILFAGLIEPGSYFAEPKEPAIERLRDVIAKTMAGVNVR